MHAETNVFLHSAWLIALVVIFVAITAYVYWPSHKKGIESQGEIPLRDDDDDDDAKHD